MGFSESFLRTSSFRSTVEKLSGEPLLSCYQCKKCSGGCPVNFVQDYKVNEIMRLIQLNRESDVLNSKTIWVCTGCKTCQTRCPNGIDGGKIMDVLKSLAIRQGYAPRLPKVHVFNQAFLGTVRRYGRAHELGLTLAYKRRTRQYLDDLGLGLQMIRKGKLRIFPERVKRGREVDAIFRKVREKKLAGRGGPL